jgi:hypothetical protein
MELKEDVVAAVDVAEVAREVSKSPVALLDPIL